MMRNATLSGALLMLALAGCHAADHAPTLADGGAAGGDADGGTGTGTGLPPPPTSLPPVQACGSDPTRPGPRLLRRLTQAQLNATLKDLFKDPTVPQASFLADAPVLGFTVDADALVVQDLTAQQLMDFADQVGAFAETHTAAVASCSTTDAACVQALVTGFGKRAFRAPLTADQVTAYTTLFNAQGGFTAGVHAVVQAMLNSPYFLYRRELGTPRSNGALYDLTPYEIASSLSYLIVGSMPDDALLAAADANQLSTQAQIDAQAMRLLADPRAQTAVADFMTGWLGLDRVLGAVKDSTVYGALTDTLRKSMFAETRALVVDRFVNGGTFGDALTANYSFLDGNLAQYYGVPGGGGATPAKVTLPAGTRDAGLLAHGALLVGYADANLSSPVLRGKMVRTRLLCQTLPPPPGNLPTALAPPMGTQTTRQHFAAHDSMQPCAGCHQYLDPVGFAFEGYDGIGRHRTTDNGLPVDTSGTLKALGSGSDVSFAGVAALSQYLAGDADVSQCMTRFWSYYAYGLASWTEDGCTQSTINAEAGKGGYTLRGVLTAIVHAPHFVTRVQDQ